MSITETFWIVIPLAGAGALLVGAIAGFTTALGKTDGVPTVATGTFMGGAGLFLLAFPITGLGLVLYPVGSAMAGVGLGALLRRRPVSPHD